jgi:hypothetical protein
VKVGLINLCKSLFSLNARIYYKLKSGTKVTMCNTHCLHIITLLVDKILIRVVVNILVSPTFTWARHIHTKSFQRTTAVLEVTKKMALMSEVSNRFVIQRKDKT